jgi:hypothetical protein
MTIHVATTTTGDGWGIVGRVVPKDGAQCTGGFERAENPMECPLQSEDVIVRQGILVRIRCGKAKDYDNGPHCHIKRRGKDTCKLIREAEKRIAEADDT